MDDIKIVHRDPTTGRLTIKIGTPPKLATAQERLVQNFVVMLVNHPGQDVESPKDGGGLPSLIGQRNINPEDPGEMMSELNLVLDATKRKVIEYQIAMAYDEPESKLRDVQVVGLELGTNIDELELKLRLVSEAGLATDIIV